MYAQGETIVPRELEAEIKDSYLSYAMSVIVGRALPDVRDGLKPVHRRILYAMRELGLDPGKPYKKSARIVGECFVKDALVLSGRGLVPIQAVERGEGVYTERGLCRVTELYEMPPKPLLEVMLENGTRNVVTPRQKFRVLTPQLEFAWKPANELSPADYVVIRAAHPEIGTLAALTKVRPEDPDRFDEDLAYVLGFWLSDGWIEKARGRVGFYSSERAVIERIVGVLRRRFRLSVPLELKRYALQTRSGPVQRRGYQARVSRDAFAAFLRVNFGIDRQDAWTKEIPPVVFRSPRAVIWAFVSGLLDGDGSVHRTRNTIHYGSTSSRLIEQLALLLQHNGIFSRRLEQTKQRASAVNGRPIEGRRAFYSLEIRGSNALLLAQRVRPVNPEKRGRLARIADAVLKKSAHEIIPYGGGHVFQELSNHHLGGGWYQDATGRKFRGGIRYGTGSKIRYAKDLQATPLRRSQIVEWGIADKLQRIGSPLAAFMERIESDGLYFLRVASVNPAPAAPTYDIQVEGEHQFIANGMVVHNCLGKYHPHGDTAVYDALVRMVQEFSLRYPLIDGQGNFGSVDGDMAAAMRYTEARLEAIAEELLVDIDKETVEFAPNFDGSLTEPRVLPSRLPNLLVNGSSGIAVGMATNIPPHNLSQVVDGLVLLIDKPEAELKELMRVITGPDFPTAGIICGRDGIAEAYRSGRGSIKVRAKAHIEQLKGGKEAIIISELPYQVNKATLIEHIAKLVQGKQLEGIADLRDESDKDGMRVVIETKRDANGQVILNQLYKHTQLETTFGVIMLSLVDNRPRVLSLKQMLTCFLSHRKEIVIRRTKYELAKAQDRAHILEGLKKALDHLDAIIKTIRASESPAAAKEALMKKWDFSERQAQAILEMQLQRLTHLEREKIDAEHLELIKKIEYYKSILASERKVFELIKDECLALKKKFGDERRTEIVGAIQELKIEDLIAEEDVVITISHAGYIKRLPVSGYRRQRRGGVGVTAMETKEEDFVEHLFIASTHEYLLFFTTQGRALWLKVHEIPQASRYAKGTAIVNLIGLQKDEGLSSFVAVKAFDADKFLMLVTQQGTIKRTPLSEFDNPRKAGIIAISLDRGDAVIQAHITDGKRELLLLTRHGHAIRFPEEQVRQIGRLGRGVRGIRLRKGDEVIGAELVRPEMTLLTVTSLGFGKRTKMDEYRIQSRGGKGVINIKSTSKNGEVVGAKTVTDQDDVMLITQEGMVVRCRVKDVRVTGRNSQGVRLMKLQGKARVASVASVAHQDDEQAAEAATEQPSG